MNALEKAGAVITIVIFAFGVGAGWTMLNNRIEQVDTKVASIQTMLGSTACTAILTRQIAAIERNRPSVRDALDHLSDQHHCVPEAYTAAMAYDVRDASSRTLENQLLAIDAVLNEGR